MRERAFLALVLGAFAVPLTVALASRESVAFRVDATPPCRSVDVPAAYATARGAEVTGSRRRGGIARVCVRRPSRVELLRDRPASLAARLDEVRDRVALFKPGGPAAVTVLALLVVAGVPLALLLAAYRTRGCSASDRPS